MKTNSASFDSRNVHEYSDMKREYCEMLNRSNDEIDQLNRHSTNRENIELYYAPSEHQYERVRHSTIEQTEDKSKDNLGIIKQILIVVFVCVIIVAAVLLCVMIVIVILNMLAEHKYLSKENNFNDKSNSSNTTSTSSSTVASTSRQTIVSKSDSIIVSTTTRTVFSENIQVTETELDLKRKEIKEMMLDSWKAYVRYAWGDEALSPVFQLASIKTFGSNSGFTLVDSMSTLWIMGLKEEFEQGKMWIETELDLSKSYETVLVPEVVTVYVGSLLSCYALTNKSTFLYKALEIAQLVQPAFNTPTGIPYKNIILKSGKTSGELPCLSDFGGYQLDFNYLSDASGNSKFRNQILQIQNAINKAENRNMKYSCQINVNEEHLDFSSLDLFSLNKDLSTNLIKSYIQSNHRDVQSLEMYKEALEQMDEVKVNSLSSQGVTYVKYYKNGIVGKFMEYSGCYLGAMLALGANAMQRSLALISSMDENQKNKELNLINRHRMLAEELTETCYIASNHTRTGLGPESFIFYKTEGITIKNSSFYLRPEFAESNFVLWRLTHDPKYRDYAWKMTLAIKRFCHGESGGYSTIANVDEISTVKTDHQPAHFLSATLKYLYLTFTDDDVLPLDQWVFNAQGHPLPICGKNPVYPSQMCAKNY